MATAKALAPKTMATNSAPINPTSPCAYHPERPVCARSVVASRQQIDRSDHGQDQDEHIFGADSTKVEHARDLCGIERHEEEDRGERTQERCGRFREAEKAQQHRHANQDQEDNRE
jgi:hypothetical protein